MKAFKMLMMAALTILTTVVFSQNSTTKTQQFQSARSKKELMKMEVMKMQENSKPVISKSFKIAKGANLSSKEQMKAGVMKLKPFMEAYPVAVNKTGKCTPCLSVSNYSHKEQMKMKVVGLYKCGENIAAKNFEAEKCTMCGMHLMACD